MRVVNREHNFVLISLVFYGLKIFVVGANILLWMFNGTFLLSALFFVN